MPRGTTVKDKGSGVLIDSRSVIYFINGGTSNRPKKSWFSTGTAAHCVISCCFFLVPICGILTGCASMIFTNSIAVCPAVVAAVNGRTVGVVVVIIAVVVSAIGIVVGVVHYHLFQFGHLLG